MKLTPWYLAALSPFGVLAFSGVMPGQVAILLVVFGIFFATLSLDRIAASKPSLDRTL